MPDLNKPGSESISSEPKPDLSTAEPEPARPSADEIAAGLTEYRVNWRRYWRTLRFGAWLFLRILWWEVVLRWLVGNKLISGGRTERFRRWAQEFRGLAVTMGGVMIKLGQFISSRVDILPPVIIQELASLQDEVPTVAFDLIRKTLDEELGPVERRFSAFETVPVAAASLGQAHRALLPGGERVVVKVQRPGIHSLVYTDLKALRVIAGWAMYFPFIARRANIPGLLDEFSAGLWDELNYRQEADHAERFAAMFADNPGIYIPRVYRELTTRRILTLEDVTAIKITDYDRITAEGIDRRDVARRLQHTYLEMIFVERFFHADPHPGNLFVYPLPPDAPAPNGQHANGQPMLGRPFYLIFVDFGMVGRLTPEIVAGLRETLIGLTTRDARRVVESYQQLGILLPCADVRRIEEATRAAFDTVWGLNLSQLSNVHVSEMARVGRDFSDLLLSLPFQVPQDFLYLARAIGILSGMCTGLDPDFDPWREMQPFVARLLTENGERSSTRRLPFDLKPRDLLHPQTLNALLSDGGIDLLLNTGYDLARRTMHLPVLLDQVLTRADRGELNMQIAASPQLQCDLNRLERTLNRLVNAVLFAGLVFGSALVYYAGEHTISTLGLILAAVTFLRVLILGWRR